MNHAAFRRGRTAASVLAVLGADAALDADGATYYTRSGRGWQRGNIPAAAAEALR